MWGNAFKKLSEKEDSRSKDSESEVSTVIETKNSAKNKSKHDLMENVPKPFADFVEKFLKDFQNSRAERRRLPDDRYYSRQEMLYIAQMAENFGFDANMEFDEDGNQDMVIKKLKNFD